MKSLDARVLDRARGALLGACIGDSLGAQNEFSTARGIQALPRRLVAELVGGGPHQIVPGQVTDDGEQTLSLARSIVRRGRYDQDDAAEGLLAWYRSSPVDVGGTTARALSPEVDPSLPTARQVCERASRDSQANGSLMRASPLGVHGWRLSPRELAALARADCSITHANPVCLAACEVYTRAVAFAVREGAPREAVFAEALRFAREIAAPATVVAALEGAPGGLPAGIDGRQQGWVLIALQLAFHTLLHATSFEAGLVEVVLQGGDTDTNGCIAAALLGSVQGEGAIPPRWRDVVLACRPARPLEYHCGDLRELAAHLVARS